MLIELTEWIMLHLAKLISINAQSIIIIVKRFSSSEFHFLVSLLLLLSAQTCSLPYDIIHRLVSELP